MKVHTSRFFSLSACSLGCTLCILCVFIPFIFVNIIVASAAKSVLSSIRFKLQNSLDTGVGYTPLSIEGTLYSSNLISAFDGKTPLPFKVYSHTSLRQNRYSVDYNFAAIGSETNNPFGKNGFNFMADKDDTISFYCMDCIGQFAIVPQYLFLNQDDSLTNADNSPLPYSIMKNKNTNSTSKIIPRHNNSDTDTDPEPESEFVSHSVGLLRKKKRTLKEKILNSPYLKGSFVTVNAGDEPVDYTFEQYNAYRIIYLGSISGKENVKISTKFSSFTVRSGAQPIITCAAKTCQMSLSDATDGIYIVADQTATNPHVIVSHEGGKPHLSFVLISPTLLVVSVILLGCCSCFCCSLVSSVSFGGKPEYAPLDSQARPNHNIRPAYPQPSYPSNNMYPTNNMYPQPHFPHQGGYQTSNYMQPPTQGGNPYAKSVNQDQVY